VTPPIGSRDQGRRLQKSRSVAQARRLRSPRSSHLQNGAGHPLQLRRQRGGVRAVLHVRYLFCGPLRARLAPPWPGRTQVTKVRRLARKFSRRHGIAKAAVKCCPHRQWYIESTAFQTHKHKQKTQSKCPNAGNHLIPMMNTTHRQTDIWSIAPQYVWLGVLGSLILYREEDLPNVELREGE